MFRPRARLLRLLGDQLIRDQRIAVFEILKNAYDADATEATVTIRNVRSRGKASIVVEDDGTGMTFETVQDVWLEPGTDYRERQKSEGRRSPRFGRMPMGEKGIGRFAAHKLGSEIELVARAAGRNEVVVVIDWDDLENEDYLAEASVLVKERIPQVFTDGTGTRITVRRLREDWTRGSVRTLKRSVAAMTSPFTEVSSFRPKLVLDPDPGWLEGLLDPEKVSAAALFHARATVDPGDWTVSYEYRFAPPEMGPRIKPREAALHRVPLGRRGTAGGSDYLSHLQETAEAARAGAADPGVGKFTLDLHIFDLGRDARAYLPEDYRGLTRFLDANGGVRVYRDGLRVYDYGEPENDWLGLDARRINAPAQRISNRLVLGAVHLDSAGSRGLVEKTNREGFIESPAYTVFRSAVQSAIQHIVFERNRDKDIMRSVSGTVHDAAEPVAGALRRLRERVRLHNYWYGDLEPLVDKAEREYERFRETLLASAGAGLSMTVIAHEVEKGVKQLNAALDRRADRERLADLGRHLAETIEAMGFVARRSDRTMEQASGLAAAALRAIFYRFAHHGIAAENGFGEENDFAVRCQRRLIVSALLNLLDNSIYWLDAADPQDKRLYVGPALGLGAPGIVVADNGPGFVDPPDVLVQPFMTRKRDGMGMGLYIANEVMRAHEGQMFFPSPGDVALPQGYAGATVALLFGNKGDAR